MGVKYGPGHRGHHARRGLRARGAAGEGLEPLAPLPHHCSEGPAGVAGAEACGQEARKLQVWTSRCGGLQKGDIYGLAFLVILGH